MTSPHELVGFVAAALTTFSFIPQVLRIARTRDTRAISLGMYLMFSAGVALWGVYGLMIQSWPIVAANTVTLGLTLVVLWHKVRERHGTEDRAQVRVCVGMPARNPRSRTE